MWEYQLLRANEYYASLILRQDRMARGGADDNTLALSENAIQGAEVRRTAVAREFLNHRRTHGRSPRNTMTAGYNRVES
jgi:hypothetical protein